MKQIKCTALLILLVAFGLAEDIQLKDGTKITGRLTAVNGDVFQIKTAYGEIKVPRSKVVTITFPENQQSAKANEKPETKLPPVDESLEGTTYMNHTANFEVALPKGWTLAPNLRLSKDIVAALESPDQTLFFLVTPEEFAGNLATYKVLVETQVQNKFKDYEKFSDTDAKLDGRSAIRLIFHARSNDTNSLLKFLVYVIAYDGRMIRLSFFTLEPLFNGALSTFEDIAASYHTIKSGGAVGM